MVFMNRIRFQLSLIIVAFMSLFFWTLPTLAQQNRVVVIPLVEDCDAIKTVVSPTGRVWMDRNLGALRVAQSEDDYHAYGWLYQWGRLADGHEDRGSLTTSSLSGSNDPGHDDFITNSTFPYDWMDPQNHNLWQGISGINNPCPAGFRLPTTGEWGAEVNSWSIGTAAGAFDSPLKLVMAGRRNSADGVLADAGTFGYYWSSSLTDIYISRALSFSSGSNDPYLNSYRTYGYSVRCIQD